MVIKTPFGKYEPARKAIRQLVPTKFATCYGAHSHSEERVIPTFCSWWMWLGKSFNVKTTEVPSS
jgi:hypothetical protein